MKVPRGAEDDWSNHVSAGPRFGCATCIPADPLAAREVRLVPVAELVDESHFGLSVRRCPECGQAFVCAFTERVDWVNSEDPQCITRMPLTPEEAERVVAAGADVDVMALEEIARTRTFLRDDFPSSGERTCEYTRGKRLIGPYD